MPHLPPGSIDGGSVTVWLPCEQQSDGKQLFAAEPAKQKTKPASDGTMVQGNIYRLDGHRIYLIEVQEEDGTRHPPIVPNSHRCKINFYFATDEDMDEAGIPREGKERREKILALDKSKWAMKPPTSK